jgi:hypothetical protein
MFGLEGSFLPVFAVVVGRSSMHRDIGFHRRPSGIKKRHDICFKHEAII